MVLPMENDRFARSFDMQATQCLLLVECFLQESEKGVSRVHAGTTNKVQENEMAQFLKLSSTSRKPVSVLHSFSWVVVFTVLSLWNPAGQAYAGSYHGHGTRQQQCGDWTVDFSYDYHDQWIGEDDEAGMSPSTYSYSNFGATVRRYTGSESVIAIPEKFSCDLVTMADPWNPDEEVMQTFEFPVTGLNAFAYWSWVFDLERDFSRVIVPPSVERLDFQSFFTAAIVEMDLSSLKYVGKDALHCPNLDFTGNLSNLEWAGEWAFAGNPMPEELDLSNLEFLDWAAFKGVSGTKRVLIGQKCPGLGKSAFEGCPDLERVTILSPNIRLQVHAAHFSSCPQLQYLDLSCGFDFGDYNWWDHFLRGCRNLKEVILRTGVTKIQSDFLGGDDTIGSAADSFSVTIESPVEFVGVGAFANRNITDLSISFQDCTLEGSAFYGCRGIKGHLDLSGVTSMRNDDWGGKQFAECPNLESVSWTPHESTIPNGCFRACSGLKSVDIPREVTAISTEAFGYCTALEDVWFEGAPPATTADDAFRDVKEGARGHYKTEHAVAWKDVIDNGMWKGLVFEYTVSFDANGGEGEMEPVTVTCGNMVVLPMNTFQRTNCRFAGWATTENGDVVYEDGAKIPVERDMTLWAVWEWQDYVDPVAEPPPAAPQASDERFVVTKEEVANVYMGNIQGEFIRFYIPVGRYFGNKELLLQNEGLPETVTLSICVWDVDEAEGEVDKLSVNGEDFDGEKTLSGADRQWKVDTFQIPTSILNLKRSENDVAALNEISITVSSGNPGHWVTRVDWAALEIPAPPPVVISHGIWDSADGGLWDSGMKDLKEAVEALGLPVYTFSYSEWGFNSIETGAGELAKAVEDAKQIFHADKVTILCHSMGGLKARHYTTEIDTKGESVDRVIQIATPNAGSEMIKFLLYPKAVSLTFFADWMLNKRGALYQLTPEYMKRYNNDHHLNLHVSYVTLAGDCGLFPWQDVYSWGEKLGPSWILEELLRATAFSNFSAPGDGVVSVGSAHSVVTVHIDSPMQDVRATHGGLVSTGARGMVEEVVEALRNDLLRQKFRGASGKKSAVKRGLMRRTPMPEEEAAEVFPYAMKTGDVPAEEHNFQVAFAVPTAGNRLVAVHILTSETIGIDSVRSPSGIEYTSNESNVFAYADDNGAWVLLAFPEQGQWTVTASRNSAGSSEPLSYAVVVRESDSAIAVDGGFAEDTVVAGGELVLEVEAIRAGAGLTGLTRQVHVTRPDGTTEEGVLEEIGNGKYRAVFDATQAGAHVAAMALTIDGMEYAEIFMATVCSGAATFDTLAADGPADDDGDGTCDRLSVSGTLAEMVNGASYRVFGVLSNQEGDEITWMSTLVTNGEAAFRLDFDGRDVDEHGQSAGYTVSTLRLFEVGDGYEAELDSRDGEVVFGGFPPETQVVSFDVNGGTCGTSTKTYAVGEAYGTLPTPKWSGQAFLGWFTEEEEGEPVTVESVVDAVAAKTLWAHWTDRQTVAFDANGGTCDTETKTVNIGEKYGAMPTAVWEGHLFMGWFNAEEGGKQVTANHTVSAVAARTLWAHWIDFQTVTLAAHGGTGSPSTMEFGFGGKYAGLPVPTKAGAAFLGWFTTAEGGKQVTANHNVTATAARTLHAHWTTVQNVALDLHGGSCATTTKAATIGAKYGKLP
ncbi:MAG: InlB B-repeat-containing protein, partial [Kiritimatiellae bacterium]|nr:InlB B-repeat-containing protein [Kiritimatiellia bacterium]